MRRKKIPRGRTDGGRKGRKGESPAISYESDFLPPVKNSRCGIVTHGDRRTIWAGFTTSHSCMHLSLMSVCMGRTYDKRYLSFC